jgi:K+-sensing histidine kinase KdpD
MLTRETSASCRLALQVAFQLPENVEEARRVLDEAQNLLENFLIPAPREIRQRRAIERVMPLSLCRTVLVTVCAALVMAPVGAGLASLTDIEAASVWTLLVGVSGTSLVLGRLSGTLFSLLGAVAHNLLVVPPALSFTVPTPSEVVRLAGCVTLALMLPALAESAHELRRALSAGSSQNAGAAAVQSRD